MTQQHAVCLGITTSCLLWSSALSAQETKLRLTFTGHTKSIRCVAISPDGKTIASGGNDDTIRFWDVGSGKEQAKLIAGNYPGYDWPFPAESLAFSPNGKTLAAGIMGSGVKFIDVASHKDIMLHDNCIQCCGNTVLYSPDGKTLAVGNLCNPTVFLWSTASNKQTVVLRRNENQCGIKTMQFLRDGKSLLTIGQDDEIQIWDVASGKNKLALKPINQEVDYAAFAPDGTTLATLGNELLPAGGRRNVLRLREATTGKERGALKYTNGESTSRMIFSPDGRTLALGLENGAIMLWDMAQDKELATLKGHTEAVRALAFSSDGKMLVSGSADKTVKLWDLTNLK